jgi:hypothetical protein
MGGQSPSTLPFFSFFYYIGDFCPDNKKKKQLAFEVREMLPNA